MQYNEKGQIVNTVPFSRGILDHIIGKKISHTEFAILSYSILKADYRTGYFQSCSSIIYKQKYKIIKNNILFM